MNYYYERAFLLSREPRRKINLEAYNIDAAYTDGNADRPELQKLLTIVQAGDHVYVENMSRLGRNINDLRQIVEQFRSKGVVVHFIKEGFDTGGHMYRFMLAILASAAEMEKRYVVECAHVGRERARRYGTRSGRRLGRPEPKPPEEFYKHYPACAKGEISKAALARMLNVGRSTIYRWIKIHEKTGRS